MDANRLAFRMWKIVPRMLRPTTHRDMSVKLWGEHYDSPVVASPIGVQSIFHPDGECGVAEVCAEIGVPYIASTASAATMEDIAKANGDGPRWYQLYWPQHKETTESLLRRAKASGYKVLVVTLDTWALGKSRVAVLESIVLTILQHGVHGISTMPMSPSSRALALLLAWPTLLFVNDSQRKMTARRLKTISLPLVFPGLVTFSLEPPTLGRNWPISENTGMALSC